MTYFLPVNRVHTAMGLSSPAMRMQQENNTWKLVPSQDEVDRDSSRPAVFRSIVVPLDGSQPAEHALPYALSIARRSGATVRIVHALTRLAHLEPWQMHSHWNTNVRLKQEKEKYLRDVSDRIARTNSVAVETSLIDSFDTEDSLVAATASADLVVMASRRHGLIRRLWSYNIADALRRRLLVPILSVRGYPSPVDMTGDPIARHILIPLDGSPFSARILKLATAIGQLEDARITLVNVQDRDWTSGSFEHTNPPGYLKGVAQDVKKSVSNVDAQIVTTDGSLSSAVKSFAEKRQVNLVALATRTDRGIKRLLRGSFSDKLIARTDLPILIFRIDDRHQRAEVTTVTV